MSSWSNRVQGHVLSQEIRTLPHISQCYRFSTLWIFMCLLKLFLEIYSEPHSPKLLFICFCILFMEVKHYYKENTKINYPHQDSWCVSSWDGWIWNHCHTDHSARQSTWHSFSCELFGDSWSILCLFHPPGIISFSFMAHSTRPGPCWIMFASPWLFLWP